MLICPLFPHTNHAVMPVNGCGVTGGELATVTAHCPAPKPTDPIALSQAPNPAHIYVKYQPPDVTSPAAEYLAFSTPEPPDTHYALSPTANAPQSHVQDPTDPTGQAPTDTATKPHTPSVPVALFKRRNS